MTDVADAEAAIDAWRTRQLARHATRLVSDGRLFLEAQEAEATGDAGSWKGFEIDLFLRFLNEFASDGRRRVVQRALAGDPDARREVRPVIQGIIHAAGIDQDVANAAAASLTPHVFQAHLRLHDELARIGRGEPDSLVAALRQVPTTGAVDGEESTNAVGRISRDEAVVFQDWWDRFVEEMLVTTREWGLSRRPELAATSRLWRWLVGKNPDAVTGGDMAEFRSRYLSLPRNYHRDPRYATVGFSELVRRVRAENPDYERIAPKTFNKHLSTLKAFFAWLKVQRALPATSDDPFDGLAVKIRKRGRFGRSERDAYSREQVATIFQGPIWTGRQSERVISRPGKVVIRDSLYWVPLMCAYQGMRREEACQLKVRHIVRVSGIWVIDLNSPDLRLKENDGDESEGSRRWLPLHHDLLQLGFVDTLVGDRVGSDQLFPELHADNAHSAYGVTVGKRLAMSYFTYPLDRLQGVT